MLKTVFFSILLVLVILTGRTQPLPTQKEQNVFLNWYVQTKNIVPLDSIKYISSFTVDLTSIPLFSKFTKKEKSFLLKQTENGRQTSIDSHSLRRLHLISIGKRGPGNYINYLSIPVFTSDRKMAFISWGVWCGESCGKESVDIFVKTQQGKWRKLNTVVPVIMF